MTTSLVAGFEFVGKHIPNVNATDLSARFQALVKKSEPSLRSASPAAAASR